MSRLSRVGVLPMSKSLEAKSSSMVLERLVINAPNMWTNRRI